MVSVTLSGHFKVRFTNRYLNTVVRTAWIPWAFVPCDFGRWNGKHYPTIFSSFPNPCQCILNKCREQDAHTKWWYTAMQKPYRRLFLSHFLLAMKPASSYCCCSTAFLYLGTSLLLDATNTSCFEVIFLSIAIALRHAVKKVRREERKGNQIDNYSHLDTNPRKISRFVKIANKKPWFLFKILHCCPVLKEGNLEI